MATIHWHCSVAIETVNILIQISTFYTRIPYYQYHQSTEKKKDFVTWHSIFEWEHAENCHQKGNTYAPSSYKSHLNGIPGLKHQNIYVIYKHST